MSTGGGGATRGAGGGVCRGGTNGLFSDKGRACAGLAVADLGLGVGPPFTRGSCSVNPAGLFV